MNSLTLTKSMLLVCACFDEIPLNPNRGKLLLRIVVFNSEIYRNMELEGFMAQSSLS